MKKIVCLVMCLIFAGLTNAMAATNRFTATSAAYGVLGYMDFDSSVFDSTNSFQFIANSSMLSLNFSNPLNGFSLTTIGPPTDGTNFDSTETLPIVVGGLGAQGGTTTSDLVSIISAGFRQPDYLILGNGVGNDVFVDVSWSTSVLSPVGAVPEPEIYAMMGIGLGVLGWMARRKKSACSRVVA